MLKKLYKEIEKSSSIFSPNKLIEWRVKTFLDKERNLEWIDNFEDDKSIIFWDIRQILSLYSIYACLKFKNIGNVSF